MVMIVLPPVVLAKKNLNAVPGTFYCTRAVFFNLQWAIKKEIDNNFITKSTAGSYLFFI